MSIIRILLFLFALLLAQYISAQDSQPVSDSSKIDVRQFDQTEVEKLRADPDMDYGRSPAAVNLWERFKRWLGMMLSRLLETVVSANWFNMLLVVLAVVAAVYIVMRLLHVDALKIFYSGKNAAIPYGVLDEDIHTMNFEQLISNALQRKEYRLAIRLHFLQALKLLADKHYIMWQPGKTNHDYLEELESKNLQAGFNELNFYFEYAWYGNFAINETLYRKFDSLFTDWRTKL